MEEPHQIGTFADFCNACGNCDVFCPEDGGPYLIKPRFFGSESAWREAAPLDGFFVTRRALDTRILGRFGGVDYCVDTDGDAIRYSGPGFAVAFRATDPAGTLDGDASAEVEVDLALALVMHRVADALFAPGTVNYVNCLPAASSAAEA